jgi:hypothetical protein
VVPCKLNPDDRVRVVKSRCGIVDSCHYQCFGKDATVVRPFGKNTVIVKTDAEVQCNVFYAADLKLLQSAKPSSPGGTAASGTALVPPAEPIVKSRMPAVGDRVRVDKFLPTPSYEGEEATVVLVAGTMADVRVSNGHVLHLSMNNLTLVSGLDPGFLPNEGDRVKIIETSVTCGNSTGGRCKGVEGVVITYHGNRYIHFDDFHCCGENSCVITNDDGTKRLGWKFEMIAAAPVTGKVTSPGEITKGSIVRATANAVNKEFGSGMTGTVVSVSSTHAAVEIDDSSKRSGETMHRLTYRKTNLIPIDEIRPYGTKCLECVSWKNDCCRVGVKELIGGCMYFDKTPEAVAEVLHGAAACQERVEAQNPAQCAYFDADASNGDVWMQNTAPPKGKTCPVVNDCQSFLEMRDEYMNELQRTVCAVKKCEEYQARAERAEARAAKSDAESKAAGENWFEERDRLEALAVETKRIDDARKAAEKERDDLRAMLKKGDNVSTLIQENVALHKQVGELEGKLADEITEEELEGSWT